MTKDTKNKILLLTVMFVVLAIVVGGYFFNPKNEKDHQAVEKAERFPEREPDLAVIAEEEVEIMSEEELKAQELVDYALSFIGEGNPQNLDSSGFVKHVFEHVYGVELPRTSSQMRDFGEKVSDGELKLGDLIFFEPDSDMGSVVGIYIGNNQFIYSSSSQGAIKIKDLKRDDYHAQRYKNARSISK